MSKHTPGPWEIEWPAWLEEVGEPIRVIGGIDGDVDDDGRPRITSTEICVIGDNPDEQPNARLIAAAPELLEALQALTRHFEDVLNGPVFRMAGITWEEGAHNVPTIKAAHAAIAKATGESE